VNVVHAPDPVRLAGEDLVALLTPGEHVAAHAANSSGVESARSKRAAMIALACSGETELPTILTCAVLVSGFPLYSISILYESGNPVRDRAHAAPAFACQYRR
jgi:hypothetical protein